VVKPEQSWFGCVIPEDLLYDVEKHVWVRMEGNQAVVGMTDVSQTMCGRFVQVTWKKPGRRIARGRSLAVIESAKWVGPMPAPLSGVLVANNEEMFEADIAVANRDPYGEGWLVRIEPTDLESELGLLVDGVEAFARYREFIEEHEIRCFRCED
jgi:glycine cleavage system H protein